MPPIPTWGKREAKPVEENTSVDQLREKAASLRATAEGLMGSAPAPSIRVQLGQILLELDTKAMETMLKKWDQKGKGEVRARVCRGGVVVVAGCCSSRAGDAIALLVLGMLLLE